MSKKSPLQIVKEVHGSKEELAKKVVAILERPEGESAEQFAHRIGTLSNRQLLRLLSANAIATTKFGTKAALVEAIVKARFKGGNEDYARKLSGFTLPKLLDLGRQHGLLKSGDLRN